VTVADALLLALGAIAVGSGVLVVTSAHLVRAGLYLVISLGALAGLYLVLGAELVAWVQVLVYVGAVVVLLLFAVMLTRAPIGPSTDLDRPAGPATLIGAGVGFGLAALLADAFHWTRYDLPPTGTAERVGEQIFGGWVLPFEVLSILLLAALVGAIVLSRPDLGARADPEAADAPGPDPIAESDAVVARLERIAARQSAAQSRIRQAAAEQRATGADADDEKTGTTTTLNPEDAVREAQKGRAADVIFGAQARRTRLGGDEPPEPGTTPDDVIEGTATETARTRPRPVRRPAGSPPTDRPAIEGKPARPSRPAIEGESARPSRPATEGRRARPSRPAIEGEVGGEKPALDAPGRRPRVAGRPDRPALPSGDNSGKADDQEDDA
jgi:NADH:ubiquinone oxidoreductase subunit 6 (subunit J)